MSLAMTKSEREAFLADVHVGVLSVTQPSAPPLTVPVWYSYQPDGLVTVTMDVDSTKARLIRAAEEFSLCVQTETPPYRYVSVEGRVVAAEPCSLEERRLMARRYLGADRGDTYANRLGTSNDIAVRMRPERWRTTDYGKMSVP